MKDLAFSFWRSLIIAPVCAVFSVGAMAGGGHNGMDACSYKESVKTQEAACILSGRIKMNLEKMEPQGAENFEDPVAKLKALFQEGNSVVFMKCIDKNPDERSPDPEDPYAYDPEARRALFKYKNRPTSTLWSGDFDGVPNVPNASASRSEDGNFSMSIGCFDCSSSPQSKFPLLSSYTIVFNKIKRTLTVSQRVEKAFTKEVKEEILSAECR